MKKISIIALGLVTAFGFSSCMTTYDAYGRPVQSVDPGAAAVGIVAAGLIGASVANSHHHGHHPRPRRHYYYSDHRDYHCR